MTKEEYSKRGLYFAKQMLRVQGNFKKYHVWRFYFDRLCANADAKIAEHGVKAKGQE